MYKLSQHGNAAGEMPTPGILRARHAPSGRAGHSRRTLRRNLGFDSATSACKALDVGGKQAVTPAGTAGASRPFYKDSLENAASNALSRPPSELSGMHRNLALEMVRHRIRVSARVLSILGA